jgi:CRP-like cAMP-binding protein
MKKILLIEDNLEMRENTAEILELANYEVVTAENGKVGVEKAKAVLPDLIICDIMMPELDGYGVLYYLGKDPKTAAIPFIFLTAKAELSEMRKGMNLGADDYLTKPYEEMELLNAIESRMKKSDAVKKEYNSLEAGVESFLNDARGLLALEDLAKDRRSREFAPKEIVFREGDAPNYLFFLKSGKVKIIKSDHYGKELVVGLFSAGEFFGFMSILEGSDHKETAIALEKAEALLVPKADFLTLIESNRDVAARFIKMLAGNVHDNEEKLLQLAYAPVRERTATALLELHERYGSGAEIRISRDDLAAMVGTATESLIRTLSDFKEDGSIEVHGRSIVICRPDTLKKYSGQGK